MKELTTNQMMILDYCINNPNATPEDIKKYIESISSTNAEYVISMIYESFINKMANYTYTYDELINSLNENFKNLKEVQLYLWNLIYKCSTKRSKYLYREEDFLIVSNNVELIKSIIIQTKIKKSNKWKMHSLTRK